MNSNIIINDFLSNFQMSDNTFKQLVEQLVSFLESDNYINTNISPLNFNQSMPDINVSFPDEIFPFNNQNIMNIIYQYITKENLQLMLKQLYQLRGTVNYIDLFEKISGKLYITSADSTDSLSISQLNIKTDDISIFNTTETSNINKINNYNHRFDDRGLLIQFIHECKNLGTLFLFLVSLNSDIDVPVTVTTNTCKIIDDIVDTNQYVNDFYRPFIKYTSNMSNKDVYQISRSKLNNFYQIKDVQHIRVIDILDEGNIKLFKYDSDDGITVFKSSERNVSHLKYENNDYTNNDEILNNNDVSLQYFNHVNPMSNQHIIELSLLNWYYVSTNSLNPLTDESGNILSRG